MSIERIRSMIMFPTTVSEQDVATTSEVTQAQDASTSTDDISTDNNDHVKTVLQDIAPSPRNPVSANLHIRRNIFTQQEGQKVRVDTQAVPDSLFLKFLITGADHPQAERHMILSTFGDDPDFFVTFGREPHIWNFSGMLRNEGGKGAWHQEFVQKYETTMRASKLVKNNQFIRFRLGNLVMDGYILNLRISQNQQVDDAAVDFQFSMYVRKYEFVGASPGSGTPVSAETVNGANSTVTEHRVVAGDTISEIAQRYGTTSAEIRRLNGRTMAQDRSLEVGITLIIRSSVPSTNTASRRSHTVVSGDNLGRIARLYGVTVDEIIQANPPSSRLRRRSWDQAKTIYPREVLVIPEPSILDNPSLSSIPFPGPPSSPPPAT